MKKNGFTLVELLGTIVVLSIIVGIVVLTTNSSFLNAKKKTEEIFVKTLKDALTVYLDSDARNVRYNTTPTCTLNKRFGVSNVYQNIGTITFEDIIESEYTPLLESDVINPANANVECNINATVYIYRDTDYVYYYRLNKEDFGCLTTSGYITNLPSECNP